jgi:hypothetical protein
MVDLNAHEAGNGGKKPREAYRLPSLLYSEDLLFQCQLLPRSANSGIRHNRSSPPGGKPRQQSLKGTIENKCVCMVGQAPDNSSASLDNRKGRYVFVPVLGAFPAFGNVGI